MRSFSHNQVFRKDYISSPVQNIFLCKFAGSKSQAQAYELIIRASSNYSVQFKKSKHCGEESNGGRAEAKFAAGGNN